MLSPHFATFCYISSLLLSTFFNGVPTGCLLGWDVLGYFLGDLRYALFFTSRFIGCEQKMCDTLINHRKNGNRQIQLLDFVGSTPFDFASLMSVRCYFTLLSHPLKLRHRGFVNRPLPRLPLKVNFDSGEPAGIGASYVR